MGVPLPLPDDPLSSEMDMELQHHTRELKLKTAELRRQRLLLHLHSHLLYTAQTLNEHLHSGYHSFSCFCIFVFFCF